MKLSNVITITILSLLTMLLGTSVLAATVATVSSTVTVANVSVTVSTGTVSWGTLAVNTASSTSPVYTQTLTNAGNVAEDFSIKGQDATGSTQTWTLAGTNGSAQYVHKFCTASCTTAPTNYTALTTVDQLPADYTNVAASGTKPLDLYIQTPTATTDYTSHTVDVTVTASAH